VVSVPEVSDNLYRSAVPVLIPDMRRYTRSGTLSGTNTLDTLIFSVDLPADITYTVTARGSGSNQLRVRCGQKLVAIWAQINDFEMSPGDTETRSFSTSIDGSTPTTDDKQDIRIRLSRDILTKEIDWDLTFTVT
jgi:hypothetical protein